MDTAVYTRIREYIIVESEVKEIHAVTVVPTAESSERELPNDERRAPLLDSESPPSRVADRRDVENNPVVLQQFYHNSTTCRTHHHLRPSPPAFPTLLD